MSGSDASYHDRDEDDDDDDDEVDDGGGGGGGGGGADGEGGRDDEGQVANDANDANVAGADADAAHEEELAQSLRKMGKVVSNLIARADSVPFREPGERRARFISCRVYLLHISFA